MTQTSTPEQTPAPADEPASPADETAPPADETAPPAGETAVAKLPPHQEQAQRAAGIIKQHVMLAAGAGAVPIPVLDIFGVTAAQVSMIEQIARVYGQSFTDDLVRNSLSSLLTGSGSVTIGGRWVASLLKSVPVVGSIAGLIGGSLASGAVTYAIGRVYATHFASGGTLLNFDPVAMRDHFEAQLKSQQEKPAEETS